MDQGQQNMSGNVDSFFDLNYDFIDQKDKISIVINKLLNSLYSASDKDFSEVVIQANCIIRKIITNFGFNGIYGLDSDISSPFKSFLTIIILTKFEFHEEDIESITKINKELQADIIAVMFKSLSQSPSDIYISLFNQKCIETLTDIMFSKSIDRASLDITETILSGLRDSLFLSKNMKSFINDCALFFLKYEIDNRDIYSFQIYLNILLFLAQILTNEDIATPILMRIFRFMPIPSFGYLKDVINTMIKVSKTMSLIAFEQNKAYLISFSSFIAHQSSMELSIVYDFCLCYECLLVLFNRFSLYNKNVFKDHIGYFLRVSFCQDLGIMIKVVCIEKLLSFFRVPDNPFHHDYSINKILYTMNHLLYESSRSFLSHPCLREMNTSYDIISPIIKLCHKFLPTSFCLKNTTNNVTNICLEVVLDLLKNLLGYFNSFGNSIQTIIKDYSIDECPSNVDVFYSTIQEYNCFVEDVSKLKSMYLCMIQLLSKIISSFQQEIISSAFNEFYFSILTPNSFAFSNLFFIAYLKLTTNPDIFIESIFDFLFEVISKNGCQIDFIRNFSQFLLSVNSLLTEINQNILTKCIYERLLLIICEKFLLKPESSQLFTLLLSLFKFNGLVSNQPVFLSKPELMSFLGYIGDICSMNQCYIMDNLFEFLDSLIHAYPIALLDLRILEKYFNDISFRFGHIIDTIHNFLFKEGLKFPYSSQVYLSNCIHKYFHTADMQSSKSAIEILASIDNCDNLTETRAIPLKYEFILDINKYEYCISSKLFPFIESLTRNLLSQPSSFIAYLIKETIMSVLTIGEFVDHYYLLTSSIQTLFSILPQYIDSNSIISQFLNNPNTRIPVCSLMLFSISISSSSKSKIYNSIILQNIKSLEAFRTMIFFLERYMHHYPNCVLSAKHIVLSIIEDIPEERIDLSQLLRFILSFIISKKQIFDNPSFNHRYINEFHELCFCDEDTVKIIRHCREMIQRCSHIEELLLFFTQINTPLSNSFLSELLIEADIEKVMSFLKSFIDFTNIFSQISILGSLLRALPNIEDHYSDFFKAFFRQSITEFSDLNCVQRDSLFPLIIFLSKKGYISEKHYRKILPHVFSNLINHDPIISLQSSIIIKYCKDRVNLDQFFGSVYHPSFSFNNLGSLSTFPCKGISHSFKEYYIFSQVFPKEMFNKSLVHMKSLYDGINLSDYSFTEQQDDFRSLLLLLKITNLFSDSIENVDQESIINIIIKIYYCYPSITHEIEDLFVSSESVFYQYFINHISDFDMVRFFSLVSLKDIAHDFFIKCEELIPRFIQYFMKNSSFNKLSVCYFFVFVTLPSVKNTHIHDSLIRELLSKFVLSYSLYSHYFPISLFIQFCNMVFQKFNFLLLELVIYLVKEKDWICIYSLSTFYDTLKDLGSNSMMMLLESLPKIENDIQAYHFLTIIYHNYMVYKIDCIQQFFSYFKANYSNYVFSLFSLFLSDKNLKVRNEIIEYNISKVEINYANQLCNIVSYYEINFLDWFNKIQTFLHKYMSEYVEKSFSNSLIPISFDTSILLQDLLLILNRGIFCPRILTSIFTFILLNRKRLRKYKDSFWIHIQIIVILIESVSSHSDSIKYFPLFKHLYMFLKKNMISDTHKCEFYNHLVCMSSMYLDYIFEAPYVFKGLIDDIFKLITQISRLDFDSNILQEKIIGVSILALSDQNLDSSLFRNVLELLSRLSDKFNLKFKKDVVSIVDLLINHSISKEKGWYFALPVFASFCFSRNFANYSFDHLNLFHNASCMDRVLPVCMALNPEDLRFASIIHFLCSYIRIRPINTSFVEVYLLKRVFEVQILDQLVPMVHDFKKHIKSLDQIESQNYVFHFAYGFFLAKNKDPPFESLISNLFETTKLLQFLYKVSIPKWCDILYQNLPIKLKVISHIYYFFEDPSMKDVFLLQNFNSILENYLNPSQISIIGCFGDIFTYETIIQLISNLNCTLSINTSSFFNEEVQFCSWMRYTERCSKHLNEWDLSCIQNPLQKQDYSFCSVEYTNRHDFLSSIFGLEDQSINHEIKKMIKGHVKHLLSVKDSQKQKEILSKIQSIKFAKGYSASQSVFVDFGHLLLSHFQVQSNTKPFSITYNIHFEPIIHDIFISIVGIAKEIIKYNVDNYNDHLKVREKCTTIHNILKPSSIPEGTDISNIRKWILHSSVNAYQCISADVLSKELSIFSNDDILLCFLLNYYCLDPIKSNGVVPIHWSHCFANRILKDPSLIKFSDYIHPSTMIVLWEHQDLFHSSAFNGIKSLMHILNSLSMNKAFEHLINLRKTEKDLVNGPICYGDCSQFFCDWVPLHYSSLIPHVIPPLSNISGIYGREVFIYSVSINSKFLNMELLLENGEFIQYRIVPKQIINERLMLFFHLISKYFQKSPFSHNRKQYIPSVFSFNFSNYSCIRTDMFPLIKESLFDQFEQMQNKDEISKLSNLAPKQNHLLRINQNMYFINEYCDWYQDLIGQYSSLCGIQTAFNFAEFNPENIWINPSKPLIVVTEMKNNSKNLFYHLIGEIGNYLNLEKNRGSFTIGIITSMIAIHNNSIKIKYMLQQLVNVDDSVFSTSIINKFDNFKENMIEIVDTVESLINSSTDPEHSRVSWL